MVATCAGRVRCERGAWPLPPAGITVYALDRKGLVDVLELRMVLLCSRFDPIISFSELERTTTDRSSRNRAHALIDARQGPLTAGDDQQPYVLATRPCTIGFLQEVRSP